MKTECIIMPDQWQTVTPLYYGFEVCRSDKPPGLGNRGCNMIHFIFEGCGTIEGKEKIYEAGKDDIFICGPGSNIFRYMPDKETPWIYAWVAFKTDYPLPDFSSPVIHMPSAREIFSVLYEREEGIPINRLYSLIYDLLWLLDRKDTSAAPKNYVENARIYIENSLQDVSIEKIANALNIDRRYLTRLFRETYGLSPQQYLMELRLKKANELLRLGHSVSDAAILSGFSDLSNFSKKYKQHYGITPQHQKQT